MTFLDFFFSVLRLFGPAGLFVLSLVGILFGLGIYKFVKDWLPW